MIVTVHNRKALIINSKIGGLLGGLMPIKKKTNKKRAKSFIYLYLCKNINYEY